VLEGFVGENSVFLQSVRTGRINGLRTPGATARPYRHGEKGRIGVSGGHVFIVFVNRKQHRRNRNYRAKRV